MVAPDPIYTLQQRQEFLSGVTEIARLCNWSEKEVQGLHEHVWGELVGIDNLMFKIFERTRSRDLAYCVWNNHMEDLRRWLSLITGIRISYV
jgi:hypothetical protein